ncbi:MAG TPA: metallophosphoesterase [Bacteroidales bacterium]
MNSCFFVSDMHDSAHRYNALLDAIRVRKPAAVFMGGDLFPHRSSSNHANVSFANDFMLRAFSRLSEEMGCNYPDIFLIPGNDDRRSEEPFLINGEEQHLWMYIHMRLATLGHCTIFGYACVPPTPFRLKDWERYDVSRYTDPGSLAPNKGIRTAPPDADPEWATIAGDLAQLTQGCDMVNAVCLFHAPPYNSLLDRAALDGQMFDHVPLDVHVGSIAIERFITEKQPYLMLHGHVHESARLTGQWKQQFGRTWAFSAAHDGPELALVTFDLHNLQEVQRELI